MQAMPAVFTYWVRLLWSRSRSGPERKLKNLLAKRLVPCFIGGVMSHNHQLTTVADVLRFMLAGNATITLVSKKTGVRFTYKVRLKDEGMPHFVSLLSGPDNEGDFCFLGSIFNGADYRHGKKARITSDAPSAKAFAWFASQVLSGKLPEQVEVWHEGRCGRCGRKLTVPESIENGIGPECATKV